jgi:hypothetical protein
MGQPVVYKNVYQHHGLEVIERVKCVDELSVLVMIILFCNHLHI